MICVQTLNLSKTPQLKGFFHDVTDLCSSSEDEEVAVNNLALANSTQFRAEYYIKHDLCAAVFSSVPILSCVCVCVFWYHGIHLFSAVVYDTSHVVVTTPQFFD